ncbi:hypothetical protein NQ317_002682 [Molorchus minor]|uniref:Uncharacterized protein n=1 Tax=Molorchus minor TaxID=1323400 RepID=A0ABQ9JXP9_9CUCU|nr:hypothetical protein NQ317_002682 [Molorchus minor]
MPKDFEDDNITKLSKYDSVDDWIDEDRLKHLESHLTDTERETHYKEALELKEIGNDEFKKRKIFTVYKYIHQSSKIMSLKYKNDRSILYANRAASKVRLGRKESAIDDCTKAVELNDKYLKAYFRRAKLYEETEKLEESCQDYKKILTFDPGNKDALQAQYRLPPKIAERNENLKQKC